MGEIVVESKVFGCLHGSQNKGNVDGEINVEKNLREVEDTFKSLNGEVKLESNNESKVLYSFSYLNATTNYAFG